MRKNKMLQRLAVAALCAFMAIVPVYAAAETEGGGAPAYTMLSTESGDADIRIVGLGTAEAPLSIETAEQLAAFTWCLNNGRLPAGFPAQPQLVLANDIDLSACGGGAGWSPIGMDESHAFQGVFDGGGHTITGLYIDRVQAYVGLFGFMSGTVKNLTLEGVSVTAGGNRDYAGGIAGYVKNGTVSGCAVKGAVTADTAGGVVGYAEGASIRSCAGAALITGTVYYAGGIVGYMASGSVEGCVNAGTAFSGCFAGGIAASLSSGEIKNCLNTGAIEVYRDSQGGGAGGIAGCSDGKIEKCVNTSNITCVGNRYATAGGILGLDGGKSITAYCVSSARRIKAASGNAGAPGRAGAIVGGLYFGTVLSNYADFRVTLSGRNSEIEPRHGTLIGIDDTLPGSFWLKTVAYDPAVWTIEDLGLPYLTDFPDYRPLMSYPPDGGEADEDEPPASGADDAAGTPGTGGGAPPVFEASGAAEIPDTGGNASFVWLMCFLAAGAAAGAAAQIRKRRSGGKTRVAGRKTV